MYRRSFLSLASAAALSACAPMPRANPLSRADARTLRFSDVTVTSSGASFPTSDAAAFRSELSPALTAELRQEFSRRIGPDGTARMLVDVSSLNIANSLRTATGGDQSRLIGQVRIVRGDIIVASYTIDVTAGEAAETRTGVLVGAAVNSRNRFFRQLTDAFAAETRAAIEA